ncbi:MAG: hypothetical protein ACLSEI_19705 [[Clostridium] innocuum]
MVGLNSLGNYSEEAVLVPVILCLEYMIQVVVRAVAQVLESAGNIHQSFSEPHTEKQARAAKKYGVDISDMSKGMLPGFGKSRYG